VRAVVGRARARLSYADPARHVALGALTVSSLAIDGRQGTATLRGSCVQMRHRRRVGVTIVLTSHAAHRSLRIRLSSGYSKSGALLKGSITFTHSGVAASQISSAMPGELAPRDSGLSGLPRRGPEW
jgi:hypothetical protein